MSTWLVIKTTLLRFFALSQILRKFWPFYPPKCLCFNISLLICILEALFSLFSFAVRFFSEHFEGKIYSRSALGWLRKTHTSPSSRGVLFRGFWSWWWWWGGGVLLRGFWWWWLWWGLARFPNGGLGWIGIIHDCLPIGVSCILLSHCHQCHLAYLGTDWLDHKYYIMSTLWICRWGAA